MGDLNCNEYRNLMKRSGRDYSLGHRLMYETPAKLLTGKARNIAEAGFGIGWGLKALLEVGAVRSYVGYEPCAEAFEYVRKQYADDNRIVLHNRPFYAPSAVADHVFCVEVIEHVPAEKHADFLHDLRAAGRTLWFSSPDVRRYPSEGVRAPHEWQVMLKAAGFNDVTRHEEQWTSLLIAQ
jgi:hypothetical protein